MGKNVGILGGSFNPVHIGHTMLASYLSQYTMLDEVWLLLSPRNPLKDSSILVNDAHRLAMLQIATDSMAKVEVCDIELSLPRPSYTINSLKVLSQRYPQHSFRLIIGSDNWLIFDKWKDSESIINDYGIIIYPRPGYHITEPLPSGVELIEAPTVNISSTFIREGFAEGKNMEAFLPNGVTQYILTNQLFIQ